MKNVHLNSFVQCASKCLYDFFLLIPKKKGLKKERKKEAAMVAIVAEP